MNKTDIAALSYELDNSAAAKNIHISSSSNNIQALYLLRLRALSGATKDRGRLYRKSVTMLPRIILARTLHLS